MVRRFIKIFDEINDRADSVINVLISTQEKKRMQMILLIQLYGQHFGMNK